MKKGTRRIPLSQGKFSIVDSIDYDWLMQWKWHAKRDGEIKNQKGDCRNFYACRNVVKNGKQTTARMHRELAFRMGLTKRADYDHEDHNGLNNRRNNIRKCTPSQNGGNMRKRRGKFGKYKGAYWCKTVNLRVTKIRFNYKLYHIGYFNSERQAHLAYIEAAEILFGEFACAE